jgi:hypothetical protein
MRTVEKSVFSPALRPRNSPVPSFAPLRPNILNPGSHCAGARVLFPIRAPSNLPRRHRSRLAPEVFWREPYFEYLTPALSIPVEKPTCPSQIDTTAFQPQPRMIRRLTKVGLGS